MSNPTPALNAALAKAQGAFLPLEKNRVARIRSTKGDASSYEFRYADLAAVHNATRKALSDNELSIRHLIADYRLTCTLSHASGEEISSEIDLLKGVPDLKALGGQISYLRRYLETALINIAADDDIEEDGEPVAQAPVPINPRARPPAQPQATPRTPVQQPARTTDPEPDQSEPAPQQPPEHKQETPPGRTLTPGALRVIKSKLRDENHAAAVCAAFNVQAIEHLNPDLVNDVLMYVRQQ